MNNATKPELALVSYSWACTFFGGTIVAFAGMFISLSWMLVVALAIVAVVFIVLAVLLALDFRREAQSND